MNPLNWIKKKRLEALIAKAEREKAAIVKEMDDEIKLKACVHQFRDSLIAAGLTPIQYYTQSNKEPSISSFWFLDKNHALYRARVGITGGASISRISP